MRIIIILLLTTSLHAQSVRARQDSIFRVRKAALLAGIDTTWYFADRADSVWKSIRKRKNKKQWKNNPQHSSY